MYCRRMILGSMGKKWAYALGGSVLLSTLPITAGAEDAERPAEQVFEEIIVSATRRAESIQDVPVSVVSLGAETIKKVGIYNIAEMAAYVPNFEFSANSIQTNLYIRGIGSGPTHAIEQSVGRFVDDIYTGRADMNILGFLDVASLEVLRGPQGTLFGKNTVAGAIVINTAEPTQEFEGGFSATYGKWSTVNEYGEIQAHLSGGLTEDVSARLAVKWRDDGGWVENVLDGPDMSARRDLHTRLKVNWDAGENTTVKFRAEFHNLDIDGQPLNEEALPSGFPLYNDNLPAGVAGLNWVAAFDCTFESTITRPDGVDVNTGTFCPFKRQDTYQISATIDHTFPDVGTLRSITAFQRYDWEEQFASVDNGLFGGAFRAERAEVYEAFTQEVRFTSEETDTFDYILGVYFEDSSVDRFQRSHFTIPVVAGGGPFRTRNEPWRGTTQTIATYGQARWHATDQIDVTFGARWSRDKKTFEFERFWNEYRTQEPLTSSEAAALSVPELEDTWSDFSPSLQVSYDVNDDVMVYASVSRAFKSGGFSDRVPEAPEDIVEALTYESEQNTTYELGLKGVFADGAVNLNVTAFLMDFEDMQVASIVPNTPGDFVVGNAAEATSKGVEVELLWNVTDALSIGGNWAYTDATFDSFESECGGDSLIVTAGPNGLCDYSGQQLSYAPKSKGSIFVDYTAYDALGEWDVSTRGTFSFSSSYFVNITYNQGDFQDKYGKLDATIQFISPSEGYSISLIGRNLTEERILDWGLRAAATYFQGLRQPRELAISFQASF